MGVRRQYTVKSPRIQAFTERFRKIVDENGGLSSVANATKLSIPTLRFWYNGERTPDAVNLITLSQAFGCSVDYLLGISDVMSPSSDLQGICRYTGLKESTIAAIRQLDDEKLEMLNRLLSSDKFPVYLLTLGEIRSAEQSVKENIRKINSFDTIEEQTGIAMDKSRAMLDENYRFYGKLYFLSESANQLATDVCGVDLTKAYLRLGLEQVYNEPGTCR